MSEQQAAGTETGAPAITTTPAAANTPPPIPAGLTTTPQPTDESQPWFKERLARAAEQERLKVLEELGVKDPAKAKKALEAAAKAEEEAKSVTDKLTETASKLTRAESELEREREVTKEWAARQMMALSPEQQAAVKAIAGESATKQLAAITALQPTWLKQATPTAAQATTPATGTAPPATAPSSTTVSQPNHKEIHAALLKKNPFAAANYAMEHLSEVYPEQPSQ